MKRELKIILLPVLILISGCSYQGPLAPDDSDPYEKTNRGIFEFNEDLDKAVDSILAAAKTGRIGDGKIFISDLETVIRIRTGETDNKAV